MVKLNDFQFDRSWVVEQWQSYMTAKGDKGLSVIEFTVQCLDKMREEVNR